MARLYYKRIMAGVMTIDDVPVRWREAVQELIDQA